MGKFENGRRVLVEIGLKEVNESLAIHASLNNEIVNIVAIKRKLIIINVFNN